MIPEALMDGGNLSFLFPLIGVGSLDFPQGAVRTALNRIEGSALEGGHDHKPVGGVYGDVHRVSAADVHGV